MKSHFVAAILMTVPLETALAGDLHGKVTSRGMTDNANAVVYIAAVPGKSFPIPTASAQIDQRNMKFQPHVLPVLVGGAQEKGARPPGPAFRQVSVGVLINRGLTPARASSS